jgi:hypothetical protein
MSGQLYDFLQGQWRQYKRRLHRVCAIVHAQALLDCICAEGVCCDLAQLSQAVETWITRHVGPDLESRIRAARHAEDGPDSGWAHCLRLFHDPRRMAGRIARSGELLCAAWGQGEDARARGILWQTLSRYFYEARFEIDGPTGQHRLRNWMRIQSLLARVRRDLEQQAGDLSGPERIWTLRRLDDPAWLAAAVLAESERPGGGPRLDDVPTVDGVLAYLYAFLPHLDIGAMEDDPALAAQLPEDLTTTINYYIDDPDSPAGLTAAERAALILEYRTDPAPMSDRAFADTYGYTRQTQRNRVAAGVRKIAPWVCRDLES